MFNSAGERVFRRTLSGTFDATTSMRLRDDTVLVGVKDLEVILRQGSQDSSVGWDGRNDVGVPVASGTYTMQWVHSSANGTRLVQTKSFTVLRAPTSILVGGDFKIAPNPVLGDSRVALYFDPAPGYAVNLRFYNLAGELLGQASADMATGSCIIERTNLAPGTYAMAVEVRLAAAVVRRTVKKFAVIH